MGRMSTSCAVPGNGGSSPASGVLMVMALSDTTMAVTD